MMTNKEKLAIFENVIARVGISDQTLAEYNKAISGLRGLQSFQEMNAGNMVNTPIISPNNSQTIESPTQGEII